MKARFVCHQPYLLHDVGDHPGPLVQAIAEGAAIRAVAHVRSKGPTPRSPHMQQLQQLQQQDSRPRSPPKSSRPGTAGSTAACPTGAASIEALYAAVCEAVQAPGAGTGASSSLSEVLLLEVGLGDPGCIFNSPPPGSRVSQPPPPPPPKPEEIAAAAAAAAEEAAKAAKAAGGKAGGHACLTAW
jgi:hypothetical protein